MNAEIFGKPGGTGRAAGYGRALAWLLAVTMAQAASIESMLPLHGPPGTQVTISGEGFNPAGPHSLSVGGQPASIGNVTDGTLTFTIPAGSPGGAVTLVTDGDQLTYPVDFHVTRMVPGTFTPPAGISRAGYEVAGFGSFAEIDDGNGSFQVEVPNDRSFTVWAMSEDGETAFAAVITPSMAGATIHATSTAAALAFVLPQVGARDPTAANAVLALINGLPETAQLAQAITATAGAGDYLGHPQVAAARAVLIDAFHAASHEPPPPPSPQSLSASDLFLHDLNPDYSTSIPATPVLLDSSLAPVANDPLNRARFALDSANPSNNVDWFVEVFQVNPASYPGGTANLEALQHFDPTARLSLTPFATGVARPELEGAKLDLAERLAKVLTFTSQDFGGYERNFESIPPGVYVSHAYSGNLWYGTHDLLPSVSQANLIQQLGGASRHNQALASNLLVAAMDMASVAIPLEAILEDPVALEELLHGIYIDLTKAIAIYTQTGQWDEATAWDLAKTAGVSLVKGVVSAAAKAAEASGEDENFISRQVARLGRVAKVGAKVVASAFDLFGKVSSVEQSLERASGVLLPSSLAIERSLFVVGHPFGPIIESFEARRGRAGDVISIHGQNFPTSIANVSVSFCTFAATGDPPPVAATLPATVVATNERTIVVRVPVGGQAAFTNGLAFIQVTNSAGQKADTRHLPPGRREFFFEPLPQPLLAVNSPLRPGTLLHVSGTGFTPNGRAPEAGIVDGNTTNTARVCHATGTDLMFQLPTNLTPGMHQLALKYGDEATSAAIPFELLPGIEPVASENVGFVIFVYSLAMNTAADDVLTLLEAVHLANGTLARPLTDEEQLYAGGDGPGRDIIYIYSAGTVPAGILPAPTSGDAYYFNLGNVVFDGTAGPSDAVGLPLDGVENLTLIGLTLRNFPGGGIVMRNHANNNRITDVRIEDCGLDGLAMEGDAQGNVLRNLIIRRAARHGVRIEGAGVRYNDIRPNYGATIPATPSGTDDCGSHGVLITGGAQRNMVDPGFIRGNGLAGVMVSGAATDFNRIGRIDNSALVRAEISGNGGPGVHLSDGVDHSVLAYLLCEENEGDGVLLDGSSCAFHHLDGIATSFRLGSGVNPPYTAAPNQGSGIHLRNGSHDNLIGSHWPLFNFPFNLFCADRDYNILIEGAGSDRNTINSAYFGRTTNTPLTGTNGLLPAGLGGICIRDGSDSNTIGSMREDLSCQFWTWNGAGVAIDGADSGDNRLSGNQFALLSGQPRPVGIHLRNGTRGNVIGEPGNRIQVPSTPTSSSYFIDPRNRIHFCTDAGILIENSGGEVLPDGTITGANQIRNNEMFRNFDGIRLGPGAFANEIGGPLKADGNLLASAFRSLIHISGNALPDPDHRNRIRNNTIGAIVFLSGSLPEPPVPADGSHVNGPVAQTGVLVDADSPGHRIGEERTTENLIQFNVVGIHLEGGNDSVIQGNNFFGNFMAGVVLHNGENHSIGGNLIGEGNLLPRNGRNRIHEGGIVISGGGNHRVAYNQIGSLTAVNQGAGVILIDTADNRVGGFAHEGGNEIIGSLSHGVRITGAASSGNQMAGNWIGIDRALTPRGNGGHGILIDGGAHDNLIGGKVSSLPAGIMLRLSAPNEISGNALAGVAVDGAATLGNSILGNAITANVGAGIALTGGGNHAIPPPGGGIHDPAAGQITGVSPDLTKVPVGSLVQAFSDPDPGAPEGAVFLGEGKVLTGGTFLIPLKSPPLYPQVTFTATHPATGSTSPFGSGPLVMAGLQVARTDNVTDAPLPSGGERKTLLRLTLAAIEASARVSALELAASGTLPDHTALTDVQVFRDVDQSGDYSPADEILSEPLAFAADDGTLTLPLDGGLVLADEPEYWLVVGTLLPGAPLAATLRLAITAAPDVEAVFLRPSGPAIATGTFPMLSAWFTVVAGPAPQSFDAWAAGVFSPAQLADPDISGPMADHDGDGLNTFGEYAFGGDPLVYDSHLTAATAELVAEGGSRFLELLHRRRTPPSDVVYEIQDSTFMMSWPLVPGGLLEEREVIPIGTDGKLERIRWRLLPGVAAGNRRFGRVEAEPSPP